MTTGRGKTPTPALQRQFMSSDEAWIHAQLLNKNLMKVKPGPDGFRWITADQAFEFAALPVQKKPNSNKRMDCVLRALEEKADGFDGVEWVTGRPILIHPKTKEQYQPIRHMWRLGRDADRVVYLHNLVRQLNQKIVEEAALIHDVDLRQKFEAVKQANADLLIALQKQIPPLPDELKPRLRPGELNDPDRG